MALYAIGDLHLSLGSDKPMDVFGGRWEGYVDKLREGFSVVTPEDTTVLLGDLSWALALEDAREDFAFIAAIPGRKILLKGNHADSRLTFSTVLQPAGTRVALRQAEEQLKMLIDYQHAGCCRQRFWHVG